MKIDYYMLFHIKGKTSQNTSGSVMVQLLTSSSRKEQYLLSQLVNIRNSGIAQYILRYVQDGIIIFMTKRICKNL